MQMPGVTTSQVPNLDDNMSVDSHALVAKELGVSTQYERQVLLMNKAINEEIGFGPFQIKLTLLAGFGWLADNIWFEILAMTLPRIVREFQPTHKAYATFSLYVGLLIGSTFWGLFSDIIGRRPSWNITLFISAVFGIAVGAAPNFGAMCALLGCLGLGLGGNLPVDGAMLIEYIPSPQQWVLTFLSLFWCLGQLFAALIGWAFIANYNCVDAKVCNWDTNAGWRYAWFLLGGVVLLMWFTRYFLYPIPESPKFLLATGRVEEAMDVIMFIARENGKTTSLTLEQLHRAGLGNTQDVDPERAMSTIDPKDKKGDEATLQLRPPLTGAVRSPRTAWADALRPSQVRRTLNAMHQSPLSALFASRKMAANTLLICACWGAIGLAYPLYNSFIAVYLEHAGVTDGTVTLADGYRQLVEIAACGIPGSFMAAAMIEVPFAGRRLTMAFFTALTGVFLFLFTTAKTSSAVLGWNCAASLAQNGMYAILYAITYEVFPAPQRGTGDGLSMSTQRVFGVVATIIAVYKVDDFRTPVYVSASFFLLASFLMLFLPYEPRGRQSM